MPKKKKMESQSSYIRRLTKTIFENCECEEMEMIELFELICDYAREIERPRQDFFPTALISDPESKFNIITKGGRAYIHYHFK